LLVVRYVGVALAFIAAFLATPGGARRLLGPLIKLLKTLASRILSAFRREIQPLVGEGHAYGHGRSSGSASGVVGMSSTSTMGIGDRVKALENVLASLGQRLAENEQRVGDLGAQLRAELNDVRLVMTQLADEIARQRTESEEIDARALPSVGVGILLSAIPHQLARHASIDYILLATALYAISHYAWARWIGPWWRAWRSSSTMDQAASA
jgi:hypothetical protein